MTKEQNERERKIRELNDRIDRATATQLARLKAVGWNRCLNGDVRFTAAVREEEDAQWELEQMNRGAGS